MNFSIYLLLMTWFLSTRASLITALSENMEEKCPFRNTVNLTDFPSYGNGSYLYRDILIPPENQSFYKYDVKFLGFKEEVPLHLRGCVCNKRPCTKMCCTEDEYFDETENVTRCDKLKPEMNVSWALTIKLNDLKTKVVNIFKHFTIQVGLPCDSLEALQLDVDKYILSEDGTLFVAGDATALDTLDYCYSPRFESVLQKYILTPYSCPIKNEMSWRLYLTTYGMAVSVLFLIPTIVVYLMLKELRGNLNGKLLICYLISLTIGYAIISFITISGIRFDFIPCSTLGYTCYFFFMAAFLWLSVLCFDIWKNFKENSIKANSGKSCKQFIIYSLYAWLSAGLATGLLIYVQLSPDIDERYKPDIGVKICWINTSKWAASIYFYGPNLFILLFNFATFTDLTRKIYKVRKDLARMTQKEKFLRENGIVILRLFLIMGISWLFDIMSYCVRDYEEWDILFLLSDFANAIQGILIFSLFVLKPNVLNLLKEKFNKRPIGGPPGSDSANTQYLKLQISTAPTAGLE